MNDSILNISKSFMKYYVKKGLLKQIRLEHLQLPTGYVTFHLPFSCICITWVLTTMPPPFPLPLLRTPQLGSPPLLLPGPLSFPPGAPGKRNFFLTTPSHFPPTHQSPHQPDLHLPSSIFLDEIDPQSIWSFSVPPLHAHHQSKVEVTKKLLCGYFHVEVIFFTGPYHLSSACWFWDVLFSFLTPWFLSYGWLIIWRNMS